MSFRSSRGATSPEATGANEPNELHSETNEMLLSEFYELAQRVEEVRMGPARVCERVYFTRQTVARTIYISRPHPIIPITY